MKIILVALFLFVYSLSFAQLPIDSTTHLITYSGVENVSATQENLYSRAREWFAKTYNSAQNVIQMDDKDKIVGKALIQVYRKVAMGTYEYGFINYTISIYLKDGKYKYEITNLYHTGQYLEGDMLTDFGTAEEMMNEKKKHLQKIYYALLLQADTNINALISNLKESMAKQVVEKDDF